MSCPQASRRVLVIIGVINYPELDASVSSKLEVEMDYYSRSAINQPTNQPTKC